MRTGNSHKSDRRGYTLVELTTGLVGAGLLMAGISSTLFIAARTIDPENTPTSASIEGNTALADMFSDLEFAQMFSEQTATSLTVTVPDRDANTNPEVIRYAWSGVAGAPLTRQYNGGAIVSVVDNLYVFQHNIPAMPVNLLSNAGTESGVTGWAVMTGAQITSETSQQYTGTRSLLVQKSGQNVSGAQQTVTGSITSGSTYDMRVWARKSTAGTSSVALNLVISSSGSGVQNFQGITTTIGGTGWTRVTSKVTPVWSGTLMSATWQILATPAADPFYMDDAILRNVSPAASTRQYLETVLQVGSNSRSLVQSGVRLRNSPL